jgi:hypothetical protein
LYYKNVNKAVLSNKWYGVLYCMLPSFCYSLCYYIRDVFSTYAGIHIDGYVLDYVTPMVFILQNIVIVMLKYIKKA